MKQYVSPQVTSVKAHPWRDDEGLRCRSCKFFLLFNGQALFEEISPRVNKDKESDHWELEYSTPVLVVSQALSKTVQFMIIQSEASLFYIKCKAKTFQTIRFVCKVCAVFPSERNQKKKNGSSICLKRVFNKIKTEKQSRIPRILECDHLEMDEPVCVPSPTLYTQEHCYVE